MSAVGGRNDAVIAVLMEPFVFQRNESSAVRFVPGRLEMIFRVERDVAQVQLRRARVDEVFQMQRAIRDGHAAAPCRSTGSCC